MYIKQLFSTFLLFAGICWIIPVVVSAQPADTLAPGKDTAQNENEVKSGIFESWDKYVNKEITNLGVLEGFEDGTVIFSTSNGRKTYDVSSHSWWGYRNKKGNAYRFDSLKAYKVILTGQVCIYGNSSCEITKNPEGEIIAVSCKRFYFSDGPKAPVKKLTDKKFRRLISDDMELALRYENMDGSTYSKILTIAGRYNKKYKLESGNTGKYR